MKQQIGFSANSPRHFSLVHVVQTCDDREKRRPGSEESDYRPLHDRIMLELPTQAGRSIKLSITGLKPLRQQQPCDKSASQS